jgi:hypothetical protein
MNKYKNIKTFFDGKCFDSKKEQNRYVELKLLQTVGEISNLQTQVRFELVPAQKKSNGKTERAVTYIADFVYEQNGRTVVEDTKGFKTKDYIVKRKLMLQKGHEIQEV